MLTTSALLVTGTALFLVAQWRGWRPSLRTAMAVGIVLRVAIWALAVVNSWQPFDFADDFSQAAIAVLHHHDPLLTGRTGGWHFLPTMAFVLAGELWFCYATNLPWQLVGRLAPVLADLALIPLVGRLSRKRGRLRSFQYACNPVSIMICAIHGQIEPEMLALGAAAFAVAFAQRRAIDAAAGDAAAGDGAAGNGAARNGAARNGAAGGRVNGWLSGGWLARGRLAAGGRAPGILLGLSISMGTWSLLLLPGLLKSLPGWARRVSAASWAIFVPAVILVTSPLTVGTPAGKLPSVVNTLIGAQPLVGDWGWTAVATHGQQVLSPALSKPGMLILVAALLAAGFLWRRADPIDLTMALLIAFLIFSPRFGDQYLMWPLPFLIARKSRFSTPAILLAAAWMGLGEVYIGPMSPTAWQHAHIWWSYLSLAVVGALLLALAGISRRAVPAAQPVTAGPVTAGPVTAGPVTVQPDTAQPVTALPAGAEPAAGGREPAGSQAADSRPAGSQPEGSGWATGQRRPQQPDPEQRFPQPEPAPP